jgi:hypothetical protein
MSATRRPCDASPRETLTRGPIAFWLRNCWRAAAEALEFALHRSRMLTERAFSQMARGSPAASCRRRWRARSAPRPDFARPGRLVQRFLQLLS